MTDAQLLDSFVNRHDQAAFAELVHVHGPMVFGVCKRVLKDHHDAEEAFQATFLILSRKAASIMHQKQIGGWLYRVAHRAALQALRLKKRMRLQQTHDGRVPEPVAKADIQWLDVAPLLDHELNSLPEKYRTPVVLCDLEGRSHKEVAHQLGCPEGTLSSRLMRARNLLAERLTRRGVALPAGALALLISQNTASASVPTSVTLAAIQASQWGILPASIANGTVSPHVAQIANQVLQSMISATLKQIAVALVLIVGVGVSLAYIPRNPAVLVKHQANDVQPADDETYEFAGTVVDESGKKVPGAKIWMEYARRDSEINSPLPRAVTDEQGRFQFRCANRDFSDEAEPSAWLNFGFLVVFKEGYGVASGNKLYFETTGRMYSSIDASHPKRWEVNVEKYWGEKSNILKLVADDAPIRGRILDQHNRPVKGANVEILQAERTADGTLANWEREARKADAFIWSDALRLQIRPLFGNHINANDARVVSPVLTDADGRFTLYGLGKERLAKIIVRGPEIETIILDVRSRPGEILKVAASRPSSIDRRLATVYPNEFTINVGPSVPIEGTVTDESTKRPLAGIVVRADLIASHQVLNSVNANVIRTQTDENGKYRLEGLPLGENVLQLIPPAGYPYQNRLFSARTSLDSKAPVPIVDQTLRAGFSTGMATKELLLSARRTQQQLMEKAGMGPNPGQGGGRDLVNQSGNDRGFHIPRVFIVVNAILLAVILAVVMTRILRSK